MEGRAFLRNEKEILLSSIWIKDTTLPHFNPLNTNIKTDILILGGGISGILCNADRVYFCVEIDRIKGIAFIILKNKKYNIKNKKEWNVC